MQKRMCQRGAGICIKLACPLEADGSHHKAGTCSFGSRSCCRGG
ncbi:TPA: hypothetical protein F3P23_21610 [Aeromonas hydrophila]|nr:hypothetical protein [Aeromonas hydrophila]